MSEKTPFAEVARIIENLPESEWNSVIATDANKDTFLQQYGWTSKEWIAAMESSIK